VTTTPAKIGTVFTEAEVESLPGMVRVFVALEDAIGSHACPLEASVRVPNGIPLGQPLSHDLSL
jgi:hypothetical protein